MQTIECVIAQAGFADGTARLTIFPIVDTPSRRVDPASAVEMTLDRRDWQTDDSHRAHVDHLVGRRAFIDYDVDNPSRIDDIRSSN